METETLEPRTEQTESLTRKKAGRLYESLTYEGLTLKERSQLNRRLRYSAAYRARAYN
jgi:hypothetical protein